MLDIKYKWFCLNLEIDKTINEKDLSIYQEWEEQNKIDLIKIEKSIVNTLDKVLCKC